MRIRFVENVSALSGAHRRGQEVELDDVTAADMVRAGHAVPVEQAPAVEAKAEPVKARGKAKGAK